MGRNRVGRPGLPLAVAATAAAAVVAGLASAAVAEAAPASKKLAPGIETSVKAPTGKGADPLGLPAGVPKKGSYAFLLKLDAKSTLSAQKGAKSKGPAAAKKAARQQLSTISSKQASVTAHLPKGSRVVYRMHAALAGVAVTTDVKNYAALQRIAGVSAVYPIAPKKASNSYAIPLQGAPQAWVAYGDRGANSTIAIIDTGIDYTHTDFGGPGTIAAYNTAKSPAQQTNPTVFPTDKVIGGYDLAGDAYQADPNSANYQPTPTPDDNPLDCNGHGSHVAGTAAGLGVKDNGKTYPGPYNKNTPFSTLRIGPGMAPEAKLYAFRVFGCEGSTDLVGAAIDRAADPNQDGDTSDHVDVVNMSLGSDFGSPQDGDSVATEAASALGITMVVASGNNGDLYDTGGSPGDARSTIAVAASQDAQAIVDALNVTAPAAIAGKYAAERSIAFDYSTGDLSGTVARVTQSTNLDGCAALNATDAAAVAGKIAFVEWTDDDTTRRCGSVARSANLVAAGATGFIFANDEEAFAAGITGSATIPGVLVAKSGGDAIRTQLEAGATVTIGSTTSNGFTQTDTSLNDKLADFSSRGIRGAGNVKPDVTAVGSTVFSAANGTGNLGLTESGTSMATPMVAGVSGLVKSLHRDWTPEQVKADIMNTADQDLYTGADHTGKRYAPNRVGSGRIDVKQALGNNTLAYVTDDPGAVSASFGPVEVTASTTLHKTIKVQNTSLTTATYDVSYKARTRIPGAVYSVSPASVTVGRRSSAKVTLTLTLTKDALTKTIDPTVPRSQAGNPREYVADASGLVMFKGHGVPNLRVPAYAAPRPTSTMTQPATIDLPGGAVQKTLLPLTGSQVNQGSGATKVESIVAGFELQATSPEAPTCSTTVTDHCVHFADEKSADLKYVGSTSSAPQLDSIGEDPLTSANGLAYFSVTTHGPWRSPAGFQDAEVYIDSNGDGKADAVTYSTRLTGTDTFVAQTQSLTTGKVLDVEGINDRLGDTDTALFDADTLVLPVRIGALPGITAGHSRISYSVLAFSGVSSAPVDQIGDVAGDGTLSGALSMDVLHPGVSISGSYNGDSSALLFADSPGSVLQIRRDAASYAADKGQGALLVHFQNKTGHKAQVVGLNKEASTTALAVTPSTVITGHAVSSKVTVTGDAGTPTGTVLLKSGATQIGTGTLVNGVATISYTPTATGTTTYTAIYSGDDTYIGSTSAAVNVKVNPKHAASVVLSITPNPAKRGKPFTATVRVTTVGGVVPTGRITVRNTVTRVSIGSATLVGGVAKVVYTPKSSRTARYQASYTGDSNYNAGISAAVAVKIKR